MSGFLCSMVGASFAVAAAAEVIRLKNTIVAFNGAEHSIAQFKFGGSSAKFDGTDDYLQIADNPAFSFGTADFTIEFWFRPTALSGIDTIWDQRPSGTDAAHPRIYTDNGTLYYYTNQANRITGSTLSTNTWYHIAVCRSGTTTKMFLDGTQTGSNYTDTNNYISASAGIRLGRDQFGSSNISAGNIDELRISKNARYTSNFTAPSAPFVNDANTILLLHFDNRDGSNNFFDDNGVRGKKGITPGGNAQIDTAQSKFGGASALFDGTSDFISTPSNNDFAFGTGDFTIEYWMRPNTLVSFDTSFDARSAGEVAPVIYTEGTTLKYGRGNTEVIAGGTLSTGTWYHVAVSRSGTSTKLFLNGTQVGSTYTDTGDYVNIATVYIGSLRGGTGTFDGHIDEVRVSKGIARYTSNFTAPTAPFVNDEYTVLLLHMDGTDAKVDVFEDDNGIRLQQGIIPNSNAQIDTAQSKFGGSSLLLDGASDYLKIMPAAASDLAIGSGNFTIECWVRFANFTGGMIIDSRGSPQNGSGWCWYVGSSSTLRWYYNFGDRITSSSLSTNTWYHLAMVRSGNDHKMFIDGTQTGSTYTASNTYVIGSSTLGVWIGENQPFSGGTGAITGHIDEFRISKIARYTANFTAPTAPFQNDEDTVLLLHFDDRDASTIFTDDNGVSPGYNYGS